MSWMVERINKEIDYELSLASCVNDVNDRKPYLDRVAALEKMRTDELELEQKAREEKHEKRKWIGECIFKGMDIVTRITSMLVNHADYRAGLEFEETGHVTSTFFKNLIGKSSKER